MLCFDWLTLVTSTVSVLGPSKTLMHLVMYFNNEALNSFINNQAQRTIQLVWVYHGHLPYRACASL